MGRIPLAPGTSGEITVKAVGEVFSARCWYRHEDGSYTDVRRRGRSKDAAKQAVRAALREMIGASSGGMVSKETRFKVAAALWLARYRADADAGVYSLSSVDTYSDHLRNHVLPALGNLRLIEIKTPLINKLCQKKLREHSLSLARHTKAVIGNVLTFAVQEGALERNPTKEVDKLEERRAHTRRQKARALTGEEMLDFLGKLDMDEEAANRDLPDLVRFFVATGERSGEALGADWQDVDEDAGLLRMTGNIFQARGKGTVRNSGKSTTAERTIPLPGWCVAMLRERRAKLGDPPADAPVFPNSRGGYWNASNLINRHWKPFRERAGFEWVTFHTFRRTVATLLDDAGLTARQIADILGHAHPSMTQNVYMGRGQVSRAGADALDSMMRSHGENRQ